MSMNVQSTLAYGNYQNGYNSGKVKEKKETQSSQNVEKLTKESFVSNGEKQLSKSAQKLLHILRGSRSDMDFMVADFDKGDNAKEMLARSNKEFTVIFSSEELEKMATDEEYFAEKMRAMDGAIRMSEEINAQFGLERAFGKTEGVTIKKFGISFNSDGSTTLFAELEKSSIQQKERLEKVQEKIADEKKEAKKKQQEQMTAADTKKITVQAATQEELLEKISNINWDLVKGDTKAIGGRFDYSI